MRRLATAVADGAHPSHVVGRGLRVVVLLGLLALAACSRPASTPPPDLSDPAVAFAHELCEAVERARSSEDIVGIVITGSYDAYDRELDEEAWESALLGMCGPAVEAAKAEVEAAERAGSAATQDLMESLLVDLSTCDNDGATGMVTNTSNVRVTYVVFAILFFADSGRQLPAGTVEIAPYGQISELAAGEARPWSVEPGEGGEPDPLDIVDIDPTDPIVTCEAHLQTVSSE
jgi:hypothetical protein